MLNRSLYLGLAAAGFALVIGAPAPVSAGPSLVVKPAVATELVQEAGYYKRRWRYRDGTYVRAPFTEVDDGWGETWVRAPFARVYSGRRGTWVRAPFVNLWVPR
jgi:hypothetical protein